MKSGIYGVQFQEAYGPALALAGYGSNTFR